MIRLNISKVPKMDTTKLQLSLLKLIDDANKSYDERDYRSSVMLSSQLICFLLNMYPQITMPMDELQEYLATGYFERSKYLSHFGLYKEIIEGIDYAVKLVTFPPGCIDLFYFIEGFFYEALGNSEKKDQCVAFLNERYKTLAPEDRQCFMISKYLDQLKWISSEKFIVSRADATLVSALEDPPPLAYGQNENPDFSSAVIITQNNSSKILLAARDISVGDVLCVETPTTYGMFMVSDEDVSTCGNAWLYCNECFKLCLSVQPCCYCSFVNYCSEECKASAWKKYHMHECQILERFMMTDECISTNKKFFSQVFPFMFTVKIAAQTVISDKTFPKTIPDDSFNFEHKFDISSSAFNSLFKSIYFYNAVRMVVSILDGGTSVKNDLLTNFLCDAVPQAYSLLEECVTPVYYPDTGVISYEKRGWGMYKSSEFFYKSCDGNVLSTFYQKTRVIRAVRPIKRGEQLVMRPNWRDYDFLERRILGQRYAKKCACVACKGNLPGHEVSIPTILLQDENSSLMNRFLIFLDECSETVGFPRSVLTKENLEMTISLTKLCSEFDECHYLRELLDRFIDTYFHAQTAKFYLSTTDATDMTNKCFYYVPPHNQEQQSTNFLNHYYIQSVLAAFNQY